MVCDKARSLGAVLLRELNIVRGIGTSHPTKYDRVKGLMKNRTGATTAVCFVSNLSRQWTPRIGQSLLGLPQGLIILSTESLSKGVKGGQNYATRLAGLVCYVTRLDFAIAFVGKERAWSAEFVVGPEDSGIRAAMEVAFPDAEHLRVEIPVRSPLPFPPNYEE
ncbi:hypothetical protein ACFLU6_02030 [Acidobacteriota bacterium]